MMAKSKIKSVVLVLILVQITGCDLFLNEQEFDPNPECGLEFYTVVEQPPVLIGGIASLAEHIRYPIGAIGTGVEGRTVVQFLVTDTGETTCHEVLRGLGKSFDIAAINAVKKAMFEPGYQNEVPVVVLYSLPIHFKDPG